MYMYYLITGMCVRISSFFIISFAQYDLGLLSKRGKSIHVLFRREGVWNTASNNLSMNDQYFFQLSDIEEKKGDFS